MCNRTEASEEEEGAGATQTAGSQLGFFSQRVFSGGPGMCCEIPVAAGRQPCDRGGSSNGEDCNREWAAVTSQTVQPAAACLRAALPLVFVWPEAARGLGLLAWQAPYALKQDISPVDLVHSRSWLREFTLQARHKLERDLSAH